MLHATAGFGADQRIVNSMTPAAGLKILLVEDETIVAMMVEDALRDLGCEVVGPASSVSRALAAAAIEGLDGAFLDVNLRGEPVYPVADALIARGVPIVFLTGYGEEGVDKRFAGVPVIAKPFTPATLAQLVTQYMTGRLTRRA